MAEGSDEIETAVRRTLQRAEKEIDIFSQRDMILDRKTEGEKYNGLCKRVIEAS